MRGSIVFQGIDCVVLKAAVDIHHSQVATIAFTLSVLNLHNIDTNM